MSLKTVYLPKNFKGHAFCKTMLGKKSRRKFCRVFVYTDTMKKHMKTYILASFFLVGGFVVAVLLREEVPVVKTPLVVNDNINIIPKTQEQIEETDKRDARDYLGIIATTTTNTMLYTSKKYNLQFTYPLGWNVGDNHLGYGTFQLLNYDVSKAPPKSFFPKGYNKIEATISTSDLQDILQDISEVYSENKKMRKEIIVAEQKATRIEIELLGGEKILFYVISLPTTSPQYLNMSIYGDSSNFHVLDEMVESLVFLK